MNRYIPFASGTAVCGVPGTGWQWMVTVSVPSAVSSQTFSVLVNGVAQTTLTGSQVYGPIALEGQAELTVTGATVYAGQSVLVAGEVRFVGVGEANPPPNSYNVVEYGADPTGMNDSTDAWLAAAYAARGNGGIVYGQGLFKLGGSLPFYDNVYYRGAGPGATILRASTSIAGMFAATLASGGSLTQCGVSDMTIDGFTGPTGTSEGVHLDSSANANILTRGIYFRNLHFINCLAGINHAGNNASAGPMNNKVVAEDCVFDTCAAGYELAGTYGVEIRNCHGLQNTVAAVLSPSLRSGGAANAGTGPTTMTRIVGLHVEGLGNLTGGGSANEDGIAFSGSDTRIIDYQWSNISEYPLHFESAEGEGSFIGHVMGWGCGGPMLYCDGSTLTEAAIVSDYVGAYICQNANLNPNYGDRAAVSFNGGAWMADNIMVADAAAHPPPYALSVGADSPNQTGVVKVSRFSCPSVGTSWVQVINTQSDMVLKITDSPGYNPTGAQTAPTVPASGTALANPFPFDCTVAITGTCTVTVGGIEVASISGGPSPVFVGAGQTITLTYTTAPTWAWTGH